MEIPLENTYNLNCDKLNYEIEIDKKYFEIIYNINQTGIIRNSLKNYGSINCFVCLQKLRKSIIFNCENMNNCNITFKSIFMKCCQIRNISENYIINTQLIFRYRCIKSLYNIKKLYTNNYNISIQCPNKHIISPLSIEYETDIDNCTNLSKEIYSFSYKYFKNDKTSLNLMKKYLRYI